jgi:hypothetical protein
MRLAGASSAVRFLSRVHLLTLSRMAPDHRQVPDLFETYCTAVAPVPLESLLGALSVLVARGVLEFVPPSPSTKLFPTRDASDDHPSTRNSSPRRSKHTGRGEAALGRASDREAWRSDKCDRAASLSDKIVAIAGRADDRFVTCRPRPGDASAGIAEISREKERSVQSGACGSLLGHNADFGHHVGRTAARVFSRSGGSRGNRS